MIPVTSRPGERAADAFESVISGGDDGAASIYYAAASPKA